MKKVLFLFGFEEESFKNKKNAANGLAKGFLSNEYSLPNKI